MLKRGLIFFLIFLLVDLYVFAISTQQTSSDSILERYNLTSVDYLLNIAEQRKVHDFDSAESILIKANQLADSLRQANNQVNALILLGHLYFDNAYFENAEDIFTKILNDFEAELTPDQYAKVKHTLGLNHIRFNNYDKAINYIQEALLYYEQEGKKEEVARALKDIGGIYYYLGNENNALDNYQKALLIYRELNDIDGIARSYNNVGMIFRDKGNSKLALEYLNKSLAIKRKQGNQYGIANTLGNIGDAYVTSEQYEKAIAYFNEALEIWLSLNYQHGVAEVYNYLGDVYIKKGEYDTAIENLKKGQKISLQNNFKQRLLVNYDLLSEAYFKTGSYRKAYLNFKQYNALQDSVYEALNTQRIEEYAVRYENMKAEKELVDQDRKITIQRYQIILTLIVLVGVMAFLIMIIRQNRLIRKKSRKILKINQELDLRVHRKTTELRIAQFSIDIAADAIFWLDKQGDFIYVNNAANNMLGFPKNELMQKSIFEIVPEFSKDSWNSYWAQVKKKGSYVIQLYYKTKMGNEIPVEAAFNFREFEGEEFNFIFSRDITERKVSEEKLKNAKEKAERSDKLKSAFLANMSHEIRTPMNAIIGFIHLLGDQDITQKQKGEIIELAQSSGNDLLNIINDIIDISKIEADELTVNKSLIYVNRLISGIYKTYLNDIGYLQKDNLNLKLEIEPDGDRVAIFTDRSRFKQIINNFINNALKYTDSGEVVIGYKKITQGGRRLLKFYVRDSGIGIPEERLQDIFDRFNQLADDRVKSYKGSGLGLAISKKLVELLGGQIGLESVEGEGSEFYFTLPYQVLDRPDTNEENETNVKVKRRNWSEKSILIVEDTPSNYYLIENYLKPSKVNIFWAKSGKEAIDLFKSNHLFDLVLMDIQLPGINGYEATKLIKAHNKSVPVIAQTAYALEGEREHSLSEGCDDYISKPIKKDYLFQLLSKHLD